MTITLRPAEATDALVLADLLRQMGYPNTEGFIDRRVRELDAHPDALVQVAEAQGVVLGFIALHFLPQIATAGDFCRVNYLCVTERARGLGIGATLLRFAEARARSRGCDRIELHSGERRVDAHRFYRREGYQESPKYFVKKA